VNEGGGEKPEWSRASPTCYFLRYYISGSESYLFRESLEFITIHVRSRVVETATFLEP